MSSAFHDLSVLTLAVTASALTAFALLCAGRSTERMSGGFAEQLTAGLLLATLALHLLPEALTRGPGAAPWFLAGFLVSSLLGAAANSGRSLRPWTGPLILGVHSFTDGAIHASAAALHLSWLAAPGLILHELPETLAAFVLLRRTGLFPAMSALGAFAIAGLTTLAGGALLTDFIQSASPATLTAISAGSAGLLLHVVTQHLLRPFEDRPSAAGAGALTLGLAAGLSSSLLLAGHHDAHRPDFRPVSSTSEVDHAND